MPELAGKEKRRESPVAARHFQVETPWFCAKAARQAKDTVACSYVPLPIFPSGNMPWAAIHSKDSS